MTLRTRLAWTYGVAVAFAVAIVAIVSFAAIDRTLRGALDSRLATTASAVAALVDVRDGHPRFDAEDREQMTGALGSLMSAAIFSDDGTPFVTSVPHIPVALSAFGRSRDFDLDPRTFRDGGQTFRTLCRPVARRSVAYAYACVWQNAGYIDDVDRDTLLAVALAALLAGTLAIVLSSTLARRALAPLEAFTDLATEIEAHDLSRRVGREGPDELGRLGSAFDRMLDRLESAFARQRRFTADASHELRAPLAVMRAEADAALTRERGATEYQAALATIVAEIERIDTLVDALLLAARADSARLHFAPVDLHAIAASILERFEGAARARDVALELVGAAPIVDADGVSLERALTAVMHNAVDFAQMRVTIEIAESAADVVLKVSDDGPGFSAQGLLRAADRFWREGRGRSGSGLGLAIADAIARAHRGALIVTNQTGGGASVCIVIPRSS